MERTIIMTGASSGVGFEIASQLLKQGDTVILLARRIETMTKLVEDYPAKGYVYTCDVSNSDAVKITITSILEKFPRIDGVIHCAGFGLFELAEKTPIKSVEGMLLTNVSGGIHINQLLLPRFKAQQAGHIMMVASVAGKLATPKTSAYAASKFAVIGYANALRMEVAADNIFVTTINPGPITTPFFDIADKEGTYLKDVARFSLQPEVVASKMIKLIGKRKRELTLPFTMALGARLHSLFPRTVEWIAKPFFLKK